MVVVSHKGMTANRFYLFPFAAPLLPRSSLLLLFPSLANTISTFADINLAIPLALHLRHLPAHRTRFIPSAVHSLILTCSSLPFVLFARSQARAGVDLGPSALIKYGLLDQIKHLGWRATYDPAASFTSDNPYNPIPKDLAAEKGVSLKRGEKTLVREDPTSAADPDRTVDSQDEAAGAKVLEYVQRLPDPPIGNMKKPRLVSSVCEKLSEVVKGYAERGVMPVTLGGDHSLVSRGKRGCGELC